MRPPGATSPWPSARRAAPAASRRRTAPAGPGPQVGSFTLDSRAAAGVNSITFGGAMTTGLGTGAHAVTQTGTAISAIDVTTASNARGALASIDAALSQVSGARATLGATQNRFSSVVSSLQT